LCSSDLGVGVPPARPRTNNSAPNASSNLRIRVEAAASARLERAAPCVMLPASTMCRKRFRSVKSNRMQLPSYFAKAGYIEGILQHGISGFKLRETRSIGSGAGSSANKLTPRVRPEILQRQVIQPALRWSLEADDGRP